MISLLHQRVIKIEFNLKTKLSTVFRFFLILNAWTSKHQQSFLEVTIYYITFDWIYKKTLLDFKSLMNNHAKYEMFAIMLKLLQKYSIDIDLLTITTDNAEFNDTFRKHFRNKVKKKFHHIWNYEKSTINCMTHVVQLILNCILKILKVFYDEFINEEMKQETSREKYVFNEIFWINIIVKINYCDGNRNTGAKNSIDRSSIRWSIESGLSTPYISIERSTSVPTIHAIPWSGQIRSIYPLPIW